MHISTRAMMAGAAAAGVALGAGTTFAFKGVDDKRNEHYQRKLDDMSASQLRAQVKRGASGPMPIGVGVSIGVGGAALGAAALYAGGGIISNVMQIFTHDPVFASLRPAGLLAAAGAGMMAGSGLAAATGA